MDEIIKRPELAEDARREADAEREGQLRLQYPAYREAQPVEGDVAVMLRIIDRERAKSEGLRAALEPLVALTLESVGDVLEGDIEMRARALAGRAALSASPSSDAADAARYRYLRDHCSSHYPMTHEQPAEWSISWEFQQRTPAERFGSFNALIDKDIARLDAFQAGTTVTDV